MKNIYINPEMEIVMISAEDVIATSFGDPIGDEVGDPASKPWLHE